MSGGASQYIAVTYINTNYDVSYSLIGGSSFTINKPVTNLSGWLINISGFNQFFFNPKSGRPDIGPQETLIKYIILKDSIGSLDPFTNNIYSITGDNIYTSGLLTNGQYNLQFSISNQPPSILSIEQVYSSFIKLSWRQVGTQPTAYRFSLLDATIQETPIQLYSYPDVPIGAVTIISVNGQIYNYSYILPAPSLGKYTISIGALFGSTTLEQLNEATAIAQIITGLSSVFSIGELLAYESEKPLAETIKARSEPPLHVVGNKNLVNHSDLVRLNTIEMQTEAIRQQVLQEPYNNINFGSYSDYISSKVGRLQRNFAL